MLLKTLSVQGIFDEGNFEFNFASARKSYRKKDVEIIRAALSYAFFGDIALSHGKVEVLFDDDGEKKLIRDFDENTAILQTETETLRTEAAVNEYLSNITGMDKEKWDRFFLPDEKEIYDQSFEHTEDYFTKVLADLSIDRKTTEVAADRFKEKSEDFKRRDAVLATVAVDYDEKEIGKAIADVSAEADELQTRYDDEKAFLLLEEERQAALADLEAAQGEFKALLATEKDVNALRDKIQRSDRVQKLLIALRKSAAVIEENDELLESVKTRKKELAAKKKEVEVGERVLQKKQTAYSKLSATISGMYIALTELISENAASGKSDDAVLSAVEKRFAEVKKQVDALRDKEKSLVEELKLADRDIAVFAKKYGDMHVAQAFDKLFSFNRAQLESAGEEAEGVQNVDKNVALERSRELEKKKDTLFRYYILSDSLLKEIDAIDAKIGENNAAVNSQQESLDALENAKETLTKYVEKCRKKVEQADADLLALGTRKQYLADIDDLEYGEHCPVCNMPVIDKADTAKATAVVNASIKKIESDVASFRSTLKEYTAKLDEINLRIGSLRAKIDTGKGYIASLQQSKLQKTASLQKMYADAGVRNRTQLSELLEKTTREAAAAALIGGESAGRMSVSFVAGENIKKITTFIQELAGEDLGEPIAQGRRNLTTLEKEQNQLAGRVSGEGAISGDVYENLRAALVKKQHIVEELGEVREEIAKQISRSATVTDGDKEVTYGQLCLAYAGKQYAAVIADIRKKEQEKQTLTGEIAALIGVLKDKQDVIARETEDVRTLENRLQNNLDFLEALQNDGEYDSSLLKSKKIADLEKEILSEGDRESYAARVAEFDKNTVLLEAKCNALQKIADKALEKDEFERRKNELPVLAAELAQKKKTLEEAYGYLAVGKVLAKKRADLIAESDLYQENYSFLTRIYEDSAVIIQDTVNYALMRLSPDYSVQCAKSGLKLKKKERVLTSVSDDVYSVLLVALTDAFRYVVGGILDRPSLTRMITLKNAALSDRMKDVIDDYASDHNLIVVYLR